MSVKKFCWLNRTFDWDDPDATPHFEQRFQCIQLLSPHNFCDNVVHEYEALKYDIYSDKLHPSRRQSARFHYWRAVMHNTVGQRESSHEALSLCQRYILDKERSALLVLHKEWGAVAQSLSLYRYADRSYRLVLSLLASLFQRRPSSSLTLEIRKYEQLLHECQISRQNMVTHHDNL